MENPKKVNLKSMDVTEEKIRQFKQLFPDVFTDKGKVDPAKLMSALGESVDPEKERFGLNWPGKAECMKLIQQPSVATLKPARDESVNFDDTENLFIEGENLEVLKLLQKSYFGKVKIIYIDPPYNTGKEFIYSDKYSETLDTYLEYTGEKDSNGRKFSTNTDTQGRYHSNWLNMMHPRLYLARNLLREDGVIFISIDDHEQANLKGLCDLVFGEENFVGNLIKKSKIGGGSDSTHIVKEHEYVLCYAKIVERLADFFIEHDEKYLKRYKEKDDDGAFFWDTFARPGLTSPIKYTVEAPDGTKIEGEWIRSEKRFHNDCKNGEIKFHKKKDGTWSVQFKQRLNVNGMKPRSLTSDLSGTIEGKNSIRDLFGEDKIFLYPKPYQLIVFLSKIVQDQNSLVMDFFAGSCTTAHAVMQLNAEDGGSRKYICIQLPEPCAEKTKAFEFGYKNIADIGKDRIRRAAKKIAKENNQLDLGFKVFKLSQSNFKVWEGNVGKTNDLEKQLFDHVDHINDSSTPEDILYELLLKSGFSITTKITKLQLANKTVFSIDDGTLLICLEKKLNQKVIDAIARATPQQVICLDAGFEGDDQLKTNAVQTFKFRSQQEEKEIVFRTV